MPIRSTRRYLILTVGLLIITAEGHSQATSQPSGGRRTELEYLERGFDLEGVDTSSRPAEFWNSPEGRALYLELRMERFGEDVEELSNLGKEDWASQYDSRSDRGVRREFEDRTRALEKVTGDMIDFIVWRFDAEQIEVDRPSTESVRDLLAEIPTRVNQILAAISTLTGGGGIQVDEFVEMRTNLAQIHALSRVLRD
jgi:hypothetical protein